MKAPELREQVGFHPAGFMGQTVLTCRRDFPVDFPEFLKLNERARRAARRSAKAFPAALRLAYFRGFVEGCTGFVSVSGDMSADCEVAYICGGIDGSAWA